MSQNGKGDRPRPLGVPAETFGRNFDRIFGPPLPAATREEILATFRLPADMVGLNRDRAVIFGSGELMRLADANVREFLVRREEESAGRSAGG
jgi:hypothetical protein